MEQTVTNPSALATFNSSENVRVSGRHLDRHLEDVVNLKERIKRSIDTIKAHPFSDALDEFQTDVGVLREWKVKIGCLD
jgi:hypothetical protein